MPFFFPCPQCHFAVQPPLQASANAKLRCPVCQFEILAGDLLQGTSRKWIVIEDPGGEDLFFDFQPHSTSIPETSSNEPTAVAFDRIQVEDHPGELNLVPLDSESLDSASEGAEGAGRRVKDWKRFKPITHDEYQRRRRASKPIWLSLVQVVLGGAAAIPVALLIIWHLLDRDFMGAGPLVGKYVPWIVPDRFRPIAENAGNQIRLPRQPAMEFASGERLPKIGNDLAENGEITEPFTGARPDVAADGDSDLHLGATSTSDDAEDSPPAMSPFATAVFDLQESVNAWEVYQGTDRNRKRVLAQRLYTSLLQIAALMNENPQPSPSNQVWLDKLVAECQTMLKNPSILTLIEQGAVANLKLSSLRQTIALVGEIDQIDAIASDSEVLLIPLKTMDKPIKIFASQTGARNLFVGQKYLFFCVTHSGPSNQEESANVGESSNQSVLLHLIRAIPIAPST